MQINVLAILWVASIIVTWCFSRQSSIIKSWKSHCFKETCRKEQGTHDKAIHFRKPHWMRKQHDQSLFATQIASITDSISKVNDRAILDEQVQVQEVFQRIIYDLQHPPVCHEARGYRHFRDDMDSTLDGFALEFQDLARHLQTAVAAHRTLEVPFTWKSAYAPPNCTWSTGVQGAPSNIQVLGDFICLWKPPSQCTETNMEVRDKRKRLTSVENPLSSGVGIVSQDSEFFKASHYGPQRRVDWVHDWQWYDLPPLVDVIPHYERTMGRFWVRAQMAHYLWNPSDGLQSEIDKRLPADLVSGEKKFIGMHIRKTDNKGSLKSDLGRDAEITRSLSRFMRIAESIRKEYPEIDTIYLATDNNKVARAGRNISKRGRWNVVIQRDVKRATSTEWMWFRESRVFGAAAIATDLEMLRRADFLIGSHQSNVYRLATELNTAWNVGKYPIRLNRLRTVDVPWYEHP